MIITKTSPETKQGILFVNGIRLSYREKGHGPATILLHGFPSCWYSWRHQMSGLSHQLRLIAIDLRGYGDSDKPSRIQDYHRSELAKDIASAINQISPEGAFLVGHDWGGLIAQETATRYPSLVKKLILINAPHPRTFWRHLWINPGQWWRNRQMLFFQFPKLPEALLGRQACGALLKAAFENPDIAPGTFNHKDLEYLQMSFNKSGSLEAAINSYRALRFAPLINWEPRRSIKADTLVLWSLRRPHYGQELARAMDKHFEGLFRLHFFAQGGHWLHEERPDEINRLIANFLT